MLRQALSTNQRRQRVVSGTVIPAPVEGWDASSPLAAMGPQRAVSLENWFPKPGFIEVRNGSERHAHSMGSTTSIESLMEWEGPSTRKLWAAGGSVIYDVTSSGTGTSTVTSLTNARWQHVNFTTSGGHFLFIVNGADAPRHYNGSSWATPTITGITPADVIGVNSHKNRLWFTTINSTKAAYLPVNSIAGAATTFELGALFSKGGVLQAMATWSIDSGKGIDDLAIFVSSRGQVAVYQGTDPASASTWSLVGVYDLGTPIGRRCFAKVGNDLALITVDGVIPISTALGFDRAAVEKVSITQRISNAMNDAARDHQAKYGWELTIYAKGTMAILNVPTTENSVAEQYVMNTLTGAWCKFTGWNANTFIVFNDNLYFGNNVGEVIKADTGSADIDVQITATGETAYNPLGNSGRLKRFAMIQPLVRTIGDARPSLGISTDFVETSSLSTPSGATKAGAQWDVAVWDTDVWPEESVSINDWTSTPALGRFASVKFRAITGEEVTDAYWGHGVWGSDHWGGLSNADQTMEINGFNILAELGEFV